MEAMVLFGRKKKSDKEEPKKQKKSAVRKEPAIGDSYIETLETTLKGYASNHLDWPAIESALDKTWIAIPTYSRYGLLNGWYIKELSEASGEEVMAWAKAMLPFLSLDCNLRPEQFNSREAKEATWESVVKSHITRFIFGVGPEVADLWN